MSNPAGPSGDRGRPHGTQRRFPAIEVRSLTGRIYALPADLEAELNVLLVAFKRQQQKVVDGWLPPLLELEAERDDLRVYEIPTIGGAWSPLRWFIDGGMTRGIPDQDARARTLTSYGDVDVVRGALGLSGTDEVVVALVDPTGSLRWQGSGEANEGQLASLLAALTA